ncbi:hypothetical protein EK904_011615 [Melospiza melodia maxima]|nr:hypothetical protein EK904_011615 [Melospiza melodia maxima]
MDDGGQSTSPTRTKPVEVRTKPVDQWKRLAAMGSSILSRVSPRLLQAQSCSVGHLLVLAMFSHPSGQDS